MQQRYVLLTAAKNEQDYIGEALRSIVSQSITPLAWYIVDDGSTDKTVEVVREYAARHPFIQLISTGGGGKRDFGAKDRAINLAYGRAKELDFDFLGVQDADIAPERSDYYESMLREFDQNPRLGIVGGYIYERANGVWECRKGNSADSVAGGVQLFRRVCFDKMGGYTPLPLGGEDWLAQLDARMGGWEVYARPEFHIHHYRPTSSAGGRWKGLFKLGKMDASFGSDPWFQFLKCARRIPASPFLLGSVVRFAGYAWWRITGQKPLLTPDRVAFLRKEQRAKMGRMWKGAAE